MSPRWWLVVILVVSAGLRLELARRGGQFYWPDESRYAAVRLAADAWQQGDFAQFREHMLGTSDHILFRWIALVPAGVERAFFSPEAPPPALAAVFLGWFGVGAILLVWLIVRRAGGDEAAATWSALFYAGSATAFLFSRHYFPYEAGLFFLLLGWWLGLRAETPRGWLTAGAVVGVGYLTYNAYWNVGGVILLFLVLRAPWATGSLFRRALWLGLGLLLPVVLIYGIAGLAGHNLVAHAREFSQTVVQGDFGRGWWFILSYLTAAEGLYPWWLLLLAAAGAGWAVSQREPLPGGRWLAMGAVLAFQMILLSDVIHRFALAGRMVKPLLLFLALAAGPAVARLLAGRRAVWAAVPAAVTVALATLSFTPPLRLTFPPEFRQRAQALAEAERAQRPEAVLQLYYAGFMHRPKFLPTLPPHTVRWRATHPHQYRPYLFEGYPEPVRAQFAAHDFSMRLVQLVQPGPELLAPPAAAHLAPYGGVLQLVLELPEHRPVGQTEPLVVSGETGRGDLLSLAYLDETRVQLVADHWGWGAWRSPPFEVPREAKPHHVLVASGAWLPPAGHAAWESSPALAPLAGRLVVEWNGELVAKEDLPFFSVPHDRVVVGRNAIGGSTANPAFTGQVHQVRWVDPREVAQGKWGLELPRQTRGSWAGQPGPQRAVWTWDRAMLAEVKDAPLVSWRRGFDGLEVRVRPEAGGLRYSLWTLHSLWTGPEQRAESPLMPLIDGPQEAWLSTALGSPAVAAVPETETLRAAWLAPRFILRVNGQVVIDHSMVHRGIDLAETLNGTPSGASAVFWGVSLEPAAAESETFPGQFLETGSLPLDLFSPVAGVTGDQARGAADIGSVTAPLRLRLRLPAGAQSQPEPLLVAGRPGAADGIFLQYESETQVTVGHDHWGAALVVSEPFTVDRAREHEVVIALTPTAPAEGAQQLGTLVVTWNGEKILQVADRAFYLRAAHEVALGANLIGMGTSVKEFSGEIEAVEVERPVEFAGGAATE